MSSPDNPQLEPPAPISAEPPYAASAPDLQQSVPPAMPVIPRDPVWSGWDVLQIAALAVGSVIFLQVILLFGAKLLIYRDASLREVAQKALLAIIAQFLAYIVVATYMVMLLRGKYHVRFGPAIRWNWPREQWMPWAWGALGTLLLLVLTILGHFLPMPKSTPFEEFFARPRDAYLLSIFAITLGPLMEELFFRGFLYPVLERRLGVVWGILLTALPFGLMHMFQYGYAWGVVLLIFLMGVACTVVRAKTGSVAASFLVHVGYNATEMFLFALATDGFRHMEKAGMLIR